MNWKAILSVGAVALSVIGFAAPPASPYKSDEVLVKFKANAQGMSPLVHASLKTRVMNVIPRINVERVKLPAGMSVTQAIQQFKKSSSVLYAEPNYIMSKRLVPNDPQYNQQFHLPVVHLPEAWDFTTGSALVIAVIDDGVDYGHPDLAGNTVPGKDWIDNDSDPTPGAGDIHGTHVAGIAAAVTNNGVGVAGSGWNSKLMGIRFDYTTAGSANSMIWAADNGAKIANMSYGYYGPPTTTESDAVDYAYGKGVLLVGAAGNINTNSQDSYPDGYTKVISVGATENNDTKAGFSDWGPRVDVAAPGVNILSTLPGAAYGQLSGTSMASPFVCGVASIVWSHAGNGYTNDDIRALLEDTSVNVGNWLVHGRVDAKAACDSVGTATPFDYGPTAVSAFEGNWQGGDLTSVMDSDNNKYVVRSIVVPGGGVAAATSVQLEMDRGLSGLQDLKLNFEVNALDKSTLLVFFWNWQQSKWISFRQFPVTTADKSITIDMDSSISKWLNGNRQMRVLFRAYGPNRVYGGKAPHFNFGVDKVAINSIFIVN